MTRAPSHSGRGAAPARTSARRRRHSPERRRRAIARRRRRLRALSGLVLVLIVFVLGVWVGVRAANATSDRSTLAEREYVVRQGDTLWSVAGHAYPGCGDVRTVVYEIQKRNRLDSAGLRPGQVLRLPAVGR